MVGKSGKTANLVNLSINPCKMCMPMGAVSALYGVKGCMSMLHGSQGCATYIRRHMAIHFNEPIDIASSSLTEQGTVFGGEANLLKGLKNLINLYNPEIIAVSTTCLAETIGEDVPAIIGKFHAENPDCGVKIINVSSPGYGGTQNEGWFTAIRSLLEQTEQNSTPSGKINIITPQLSPADTRWLKSFLSETGIDFILLPDLSDNLDGATVKKYSRLKPAGTTLDDISKMAGSRLTIEFSEYTNSSDSPAEYLCEAYGVPFVKLPLPIGIRAMDALVCELEKHGGVLSEEARDERGRYLDAMIDSHKFCAEVRAAIFGEPDFVTAVTRLCCENGVLPILAATGSMSAAFRQTITEESAACGHYHFAGEPAILDDCDFAAIERVCREQGANLLIGSSDGRRIAHEMNIPLIRCTFPIHDHIGGQRVRTLGFEGSLSLLDSAANAMLEKKESGFRKELLAAYFKPQAKEPSGSHPCFGEGNCDNARVHLAVAPKCNIKCNYCRLGFDCVNESRPGVTSKVLSPLEAFEHYKTLKAKIPKLTVAGIAGPGDALANFEETAETLRLIREFDPDVTFCLSTNGLLLPLYASELKRLGVSHVSVTINAVEPDIAAKIYSSVSYMGEEYTGIEAASILLANQLAGVKMLSQIGIICKVNCVALKGVNDRHIVEVAKKAAELGAFVNNIMPHIPVKDTVFRSLTRMTEEETSALQEQCGKHIRQMTHCRQCRADAAGTLKAAASHTALKASATTDPPVKLLRKFAVATKTGRLVDMHFGHAEEFHIWQSDGQITQFLETRQADKYCSGPECGDKDDKWTSVISVLQDCEAVLALRIGVTPEMRLAECGIKAIMAYDRIETAVEQAANMAGVSA